MLHLARSLDCLDCQQSFPFSSEQQGLCAELGFDDPNRCPGCRRALENLRRRRNHEVGTGFAFTG
jgi:hypothetical protein